MRIFDASLRIGALGCALALVYALVPITGPATALDGSKIPGAQAMSPLEAFRDGTAQLKTDKVKAITSLEYAAEKGHAMAQWKLGRMYAEGDGVPRDDLRAFEYFRRIADTHAEDNPGTPQARFVASAFVALGHYYLEGIPETEVKPNPTRARQMFSYAASYFGDPDAQYYLARLYIDGAGVPADTRQAMRWLMLSANKGQYQAQARLGALLFQGEQVPRQAARGLMYLTLAKDAAPQGETWIGKVYDSAFAQATDDERTLALVYLERWMKNRRD